MNCYFVCHLQHKRLFADLFSFKKNWLGSLSWYLLSHQHSHFLGLGTWTKAVDLVNTCCWGWGIFKGKGWPCILSVTLPPSEPTQNPCRLWLAREWLEEWFPFLRGPATSNDSIEGVLRMQSLQRPCWLNPSPPRGWVGWRNWGGFVILAATWQGKVEPPCPYSS